MSPGWRCSTTPVFTRRMLASRRTRLIASLIYLRYSKRRYLKFYRAFDRFKMNCFFQAARFQGQKASGAAKSLKTGVSFMGARLANRISCQCAATATAEGRRSIPT